ncbi:MAG: D-aminoacylase [Planctomycetaceae bacterium]|nr:D-aminoacylase [Planctomycetaceae bacterium]
MTGATAPQLEPLDKLLTSFVGDHKIPGAALAVSRKGKLVYARGCGFADVSKQEVVEPASLFRIASLSKPITAVAVLQLMERGKLKLEDPILQHLSVLVPMSEADRQAHPWQKITIRHCLHHTGGWDSKASFDPMFRPILIAEALQIPSPPAAINIIRFMSTKPIDFPVGDRYAYSNFGYSILGRIIEQASGQTYEQYVQEHVLRPVGVKSARLGKTLLKDCTPGEVLYYDADKTGPSVFAETLKQKVPTPYGVWCLESMDANGGWVFSAVDLVRFATGLDESSQKPLLQPATRKLVLSCRPAGPAGFEANGKPKPSFYGFGWNTRPLQAPDHAHLWHHGALDGVSTLMVHRDDDFDWVILFNTRDKVDGKLPSSAIDIPIHKTVDSIKIWPETDLFSTFEQPARSLRVAESRKSSALGVERLSRNSYEIPLQVSKPHQTCKSVENRLS